MVPNQEQAMVDLVDCNSSISPCIHLNSLIFRKIQSRGSFETYSINPGQFTIKQSKVSSRSRIYFTNNVDKFVTACGFGCSLGHILGATIWLKQSI